MQLHEGQTCIETDVCKTPRCSFSSYLVCDFRSFHSIGFIIFEETINDQDSRLVLRRLKPSHDGKHLSWTSPHDLSVSVSSKSMDCVCGVFVCVSLWLEVTICMLRPSAWLPGILAVSLLIAVCSTCSLNLGLYSGQGPGVIITLV